MPRQSSLLIAVFTIAFSASLNAQVSKTWNLDFPTSQTGPAQEHFLEAVTYMHLHLFEDAEKHFQAAQKLAPDFAMAYWGEALNQHRTVWRIHRYEEALHILDRLGASHEERLAKAPTPREKDYISAIELLYGAGTQMERESAYSQAMLAISENYPDDIEALAWYTLSLMRITPDGMTRQQTRSLMATSSLRVLSKNPGHPGANRYLIQSTDDPENTDFGLIAVNNLAMIDTDAAEALHIPSHYWLQHGMWNEVADSNMKAFDASMAWVDANGWSLEDLNDHNYGHLLRFANYGYLQAGVLDGAAAIRERVRADFIKSGLVPEIEGPFVDTHARWVLDLEQWEQVDNLLEIAREYDISNVGMWQAIGIAAVKRNNLELANEAISKLTSLGGDAASDAQVSARTIDGLIHFAQGHNSIALEILKQNSELNWMQPVTLLGVPPRPLKPPMEVYAEVLLGAGQPLAALQEFQKGLTRYSGRTTMLLGAARAANQIGNADLAEMYYQQLARNWVDVATEHPFVQEVTEALH